MLSLSIITSLCVSCLHNRYLFQCSIIHFISYISQYIHNMYTYGYKKGAKFSGKGLDAKVSGLIEEYED